MPIRKESPFVRGGGVTGTGGVPGTVTVAPQSGHLLGRPAYSSGTLKALPHAHPNTMGIRHREAGEVGGCATLALRELYTRRAYGPTPVSVSTGSFTGSTFS